MSEELLYDEKIEQEVFKEILDALTFIEPEFISREDYKKLEGNILKKIEYSEGEEKENEKSIDRKDFKLFLPENITNNDKIEIYNILENKFSKDLGFITGERKIKAKIFYAVQDILNKENNLEKNQDYKQIEELYKKIFGEENIPNNDYIKKFLSDLTQKERLEFRRDYINLARKSKNGENISEILDGEIGFHFEELFFRHGVNNLRFGLSIMTEGERIINLIKNPKIPIISHYITKNLLSEEKLLRDKIHIDKYVKELEKARTTGDKVKISEKELEATNKIIKELYNNIPYQSTKESYGDKPSKIQQSKELFCVGFSIVGHVFLEELGIKHKGLQIKNHSALEVIIGGKKYFFDATRKGTIEEYKNKKLKGIYDKAVFQNSNVFKNIYLNELYSTENISGNTEKVLLNQMYNNLGVAFIKDKKGELFFKKALELNNSSPANYENLAVYNRKISFKMFFLYFTTSEIISGNNSLFTFLFYKYKKEIKKIKDYVLSKDFEGLRLYLLELEEKEKV